MSGVIMTFPKTWEEYEKYWGFNDSEEVYTNNARLISSFRVKQWLDHIKEAEPKIGRWERYKYGWACSNCRCDPMGMTDYLQSKEELYHYCPNCGAKMEVDDERFDK